MQLSCLLSRSRQVMPSPEGQVRHCKPHPSLVKSSLVNLKLTCHLMPPTVMERESTGVLWKTTHEHAWWVSCLGIKHRSWANLCLKQLKCFAGGNGMTQDFGSKSPSETALVKHRCAQRVRCIHSRRRGGAVAVAEFAKLGWLRRCAVQQVAKVTDDWGIWKCLLDLVGTDLYFQSFATNVHTLAGTKSITPRPSNVKKQNQHRRITWYAHL